MVVNSNSVRAAFTFIFAASVGWSWHAAAAQISATPGLPPKAIAGAKSPNVIVEGRVLTTQGNTNRAPKSDPLYKRQKGSTTPKTPESKGQPPQSRPPYPRPPIIVIPTRPYPRPPVIVTPRQPRPKPPVIATPLPPRVTAQPVIPPSPPERRAPPPARSQPPAALPAIDLDRTRDREIIIAVADSVSDGDTLAIGRRLNLNVEVQYRSSLLGLKIVRLRVPDNRSLRQALDQVTRTGATDRRIIAVQPNYVFETTQAATAATAVNAVLPIPQYATDKVRLAEAHQVAMGRDVLVAVIDTGMDSQHPELVGAITDSFDAIGEGRPAAEAHGTAIAGIVAARRQIRGMAPDASVLAVRAFASNAAHKPQATTLSLIKALDWAALKRARVVNMSFAGPKDPLLHRIIEAAANRGLIMVAAAGNGGPQAASAYPAAYAEVIAVTASDSDDQVYDRANRGSYIALAAPGVDILALAPAAAYEMSSGTSLAAAHVSGIIALILERKPALNTDEIRGILARSARDPDRTATMRGLGAGIIDAAKALAEAN